MTTTHTLSASGSSSLAATLRRYVTRRNAISFVLALIGLFVLLSANATYDYTVTTTLTFEPGQTEEVAHIVVPTLAYLQITSVFFIVAGLLGILAPAQLRRFATGLPSWSPLRLEAGPT